MKPLSRIPESRTEILRWIGFKRSGSNFAALEGKQPKRQYDVVVIGGGHNGLVAAAYLAKAGASVCVLERRHMFGGAAITEEIVPGFKFSRASYLLSLLRPQIVHDLQLKTHGLKLYLRNPSCYTPLREELWDSGSRSLLLGMGKQENANQISKFSQRDALAYAKYESLLENLVNKLDPLLDLSPIDIVEALNKGSNIARVFSIYRNPQLRVAAMKLLSLGHHIQDLYELLTAPIDRVLSRWFESEPLKATLATDALIGTMASPTHTGTGYVLLHHVMGSVDGVKGAWAYPEGGMGAVTQAMASSAKAYGAELHTNQVVMDILLDGSGQAKGVATTQGAEIAAKLVLSNATASATVELLPVTTITSNFAKAVRSIDYESPVTKINVALSRLPNFSADLNISKSPMPHHQCTIHLNCENISMLTDAYNDAKAGQLPNRPMIEMVIPSSLDTTISPPGSHVCLLFTQFTPYSLAGASWDTKTKGLYSNIPGVVTKKEGVVVEWSLKKDRKNVF